LDPESRRKVGSRGFISNPKGKTMFNPSSRSHSQIPKPRPIPRGIYLPADIVLSEIEWDFDVSTQALNQIPPQIFTMAYGALSGGAA
jgi:hypothetical protein